MNLTPDFIIDYIDKVFKGDYKLSGGYEEIMVCSPFCPDTKYHLSINTETGLWQDFKSGERGNFPQLYAHLEKITIHRSLTDLSPIVTGKQTIISS